MKGVRSRLGLSLGKKPKETKTSPTETKLPTSAMPGRSSLGTGLGSRTNLPLVTGTKRGQIPTRDTSRLATNKSPPNPSKEGSGNPLKPNQKKGSKSDYPKSGANIIQDLLGTQIDSDTPNRSNKEFDDNPKTDAGVFTGDYMSDLTKEMEDLNTNQDNNGGAQMLRGTTDTDEAGHPLDRHGINIVKSIHVVHDEDDDDENTDKSSSSSNGKRINFPAKDDPETTDDPKRSGSPFIEFPDADKDVTYLDPEKDIVYMYPKDAPRSPEMKSRSRVDADSNRRETKNYFRVGDGLLSGSPELNMDDRSGDVFYNHRFKKDYSNSSKPYDENTPVFDQKPINYDQVQKNRRYDSDFPEDVRSFESGYDRTPINYDQLNKNRFDPDFSEDSFGPGYDRRPINHDQFNSNRFDRDFQEDDDCYRTGNKRIVSDPEEFRKNTYGLGPDNEGLYSNYGLNGGSRYPNMPDQTSFNDPPPRRNKYKNDKSGANVRDLQDQESLRLYEYEYGGHRQSGRNVSQDFEGFAEEERNNPEKISNIDYIEKKSIQRANARPVQQSLQNSQNFQNSQNLQNSQNSSADSAKNRDANKREIRTPQNDNVKDLHSKGDSRDHNNQNDQNTLKDRNIYSTLKNEDGSSRQLSMFGRWMVTHGNLVDPQNFCPVAYATQPDQYINLSNYEMDTHGRWLDKNGRYVTPFFYCFGYDGEPMYLGDCDYNNGFHDNYANETGYNDDFANNPEKYIDLSDYQMNMDEQWVNSLGSDIDPFSDWYNDDSEDEEYNEYSWMYDRPQFLEDSGLPNPMDGSYPNFCQPDAAYFADADGPFPMGVTFSETCEYWDFAEPYGCMENGLDSRQQPWQAPGEFYTGFTGQNEQYFVEEPDSVPHQQNSSKDND